MTLWFAVALLGQWLFVVYIVTYYGGALLQGKPEKWAQFLQHGFIAADQRGNLALALHIALAAVITAAGPLQLIPALRARFPTFHRWNGRLYMATSVIASITALYLLWIRNTVPAGTELEHLGITLDALFIIGFAALTLKYALARRFDVHRRWAIRFFIAANGQWFFRIGVFGWILINRGPLGFDPDTFQGPFLTFWSFADTLLPLAVFEIYSLSQRNPSPKRSVAMTAVLSLLSLATAIGIFSVFTAFWLPNL